jgi:hypothetical protein
VLDHLGPGHDRLGHLAAFQIGDRRQFREVEIAPLVLDQQGDGRSARPALGRSAANADDRQGAADDRLDPVVLGIDEYSSAPNRLLRSTNPAAGMPAAAASPILSALMAPSSSE